MFQINVLSRTPVYEQLMRQLESFLLAGVLKPGDQLPSVRSVALNHNINPRTILHAYGELEHRGLIRAVHGRGFFVEKDALNILRQDQNARLPALTKLVHEMILAGVNKEAILSAVKEAFDAAEKTTKEKLL